MGCDRSVSKHWASKQIRPEASRKIFFKKTKRETHLDDFLNNLYLIHYFAWDWCTAYSIIIFIFFSCFCNDFFYEVSTHILSAQLNYKVSTYTELPHMSGNQIPLALWKPLLCPQSLLLPKDNHILTSNAIDLFCLLWHTYSSV